MRKEHIAWHLHVKNSVRLHQAEAWMISFFLSSRQRKRKRAFFHESLLEGATHFMEVENDQDIINDVASIYSILSVCFQNNHYFATGNPLFPYLLLTLSVYAQKPRYWMTF